MVAGSKIEKVKIMEQEKELRLKEVFDHENADKIYLPFGTCA